MSQGLDDALGVMLTLDLALRREFGVAIDAHPGGVGAEAGAVNRAFLVAARVIVGAGYDAPTAVSDVLRRVALRRLAGYGVRPERAEVVASSEPGHGDRWLAYLALAPG